VFIMVEDNTELECDYKLVKQREEQRGDITQLWFDLVRLDDSGDKDETVIKGKKLTLNNSQLTDGRYESRLKHFGRKLASQCECDPDEDKDCDDSEIEL